MNPFHYINNLGNKIKSHEVVFPNPKEVAKVVYVALAMAVGTAIFISVQSFFIKKEITESPPMVLPPAQVVTNQDYSEVLKRNLFNIDGSLPDSEGVGSLCTKVPIKSSLPFYVTGIIYGGSGPGSVAVLKRQGGNDNIYTVGNKVTSEYEIVDILQDKILVKGTRCIEFIALEYPAIPASRARTKQAAGSSDYAEKGFERNGFNTTTTRQWVNNILNNNLASTLEEARAVPNVVGGQIKGFMLTQIISGSVYEKIGFKDGDVVSSINGIELNDAARAIQTLNSLKSESRVELQAIRGGQPITFNLNVQ